VTVEWQDVPHQPSSPERLAQQIRQLIDHDHGPQAKPFRFTVRVKTDDGAAEVVGASGSSPAWAGRRRTIVSLAWVVSASWTPFSLPGLP